MINSSLGVPATLNKLQKVPGNNTYILAPYPSWDMQTAGVYGQLQNCQSMTLDSVGNMYVIEVGRRNFFESDTSLTVNGPPGVWIINTETSEVKSKYLFPSSVASPTDSFVNDIVLDESKSMAYLTDAWGDGGLIAFDYKRSISRRYSGSSTMRDPTYVMFINGVNYGTETFTTPVDGIAITDDGSAIFYSPVQGNTLYRLPTSVLRDFNSSSEAISAAVDVIPGDKGTSDGLMYWNGVLYYGSLAFSTYYALKINSKSTPNVSVSAVPVWPDPVNMRWVRFSSLLYLSCPIFCYMYVRLFQALFLSMSMVTTHLLRC
jgi:hypothetical protein